MAKAARQSEEAAAASDNMGGAVTETVTYTPGQQDPSTTTWCGHVFRANVPKEISGRADGTAREQLNLHLIESARNNPHFTVAGAPRNKVREARALPETAEGYRAYAVDWIKSDGIEHAHDLIARLAKDRELQLACEVGADDFSYLSTLFMPRLHELAKADELSEAQVSSLWISAGFNQLPW